MPATFTCSVITPESHAIEGEFIYASIPAWDGLLGVAPGRAAMVIKLGDGLLRLEEEDGKSRWYFVGGGFAQMKRNVLCLLTSELIPASEADARAAAKALEEVEGKLAVTEQEVQRRDARAERARLLINLSRKAG
ncbi:MAG: F0F1 ATP synthase subunit epsilon [Phycisphaeraceae bacterium]|nr:F0F1 ATP synthase subunit epsilon [Phycisphaeraceae bacterium]